MLDSDLDLLETYLDGDLPVSEAEGLWRRLAVEPELIAVLDELRAQRSMRMAAWTSMEPTEQAALALKQRVAGSVRRQRTLDWAYRGARYFTAAAACIVVGFGVGWGAHGAGNAGIGQNTQNVQSIASGGNGTQGNVMPGVATSGGNNTGGYPVAIHDTNGNLIGEPRFDSPQDATQFINALNGLQTKSPPHDLGANVVPVSVEQF